MLDPRQLREKRDAILESCRQRRIQADVDGAITEYEKLSAMLTESNEMNRRRNDHQKSGNRPMSDAERTAHAEAGRKLKDDAAGLDDRIREQRSLLESKMMQLPNFIHPDVPIGGEEDYRVVKPGTPPEFGFKPLDHLALAEKHNLLDFEAGARVAGQKWYYLKNEAVLLDLALTRFALDLLLEEGFTPTVTPDVAKPDVVQNIGFTPRGEETQIYSIEGHDLCLIGTAEITLGGMLGDRIVDESELPIRLAGISHCFRTEAGSHGRESRGLYRVHQFTKTEMFVFCRPEDSDAELEKLRCIEEKVFDALEFPYQVIDVASGDLGAPAYRKYDLEAWMPGRGESGGWGEVTSTSNCTDFQARRLQSRFRREGKKKPELLHTLNGTAISNARALLALLEIHQQPDGSIAIPKALIPYVGRDRIGTD
ncbi:MAG: serine--tRNA ligase [bacterium TMED88]|nr:serine--tRNA ligase [Deltaproteobacteria bacterium]OUV21055.1 MAG: serine--tRNA ligase [bacterium TMED88]